MRRLAVAATLLVLAGACGAPGEAVESSRVVLDEFSVTVDAARWRRGPVSVAIENAGEFGHTLVVTADDGRVVSATDVIPAGAASELSLDLDPGGYQLTCRIVIETGDGGIVDHFEEGMFRDVRVVG